MYREAIEGNRREVGEVKEVEVDVDGKGVLETISFKLYDCLRSMMWLSNQRQISIHNLIKI